MLLLMAVSMQLFSQLFKNHIQSVVKKKNGAGISVILFRMHSSIGVLIIILPQAIVTVIKLPVCLVVGSFLFHRHLAESAEDD